VASLDGGNVVLDFVDSDGPGGSGAMTLSKRYLWGEQVDELLAQEDVTKSISATDRVLWPVVDHLGTVRDLVKQDGTVAEHFEYDGFGQVVSGDTSLTRYLFTSREFDVDTGLQYNRARWYDAATGRWMSEDPLGFAAGDVNTARYVGNGVVASIDRSGFQDDRRTNQSTSRLPIVVLIGFGPWRRSDHGRGPWLPNPAEQLVKDISDSLRIIGVEWSPLPGVGVVPVVQPGPAMTGYVEHRILPVTWQPYPQLRERVLPPFPGFRLTLLPLPNPVPVLFPILRPPHDRVIVIGIGEGREGRVDIEVQGHNSRLRFNPFLPEHRQPHDIEGRVPGIESPKGGRVVPSKNWTDPHAPRVVPLSPPRRLIQLIRSQPGGRALPVKESPNAGRYICDQLCYTLHSADSRHRFSNFTERVEQPGIGY